MIQQLILSILFLFFCSNELGDMNDPGPLKNAVERNVLNTPTEATDVTLYQWPTAPDLPITSAFADFRLSHFHGGIDVSTFGKTGYPVYASREGSVVRISVSPYGYGKMLLLQHPDGFYTRYAHLKKFASRIERIVKDYQRKKGTYSVEVELQPNDIPVEKGELIAYTGNTGAGDEHLHFEILDPEMNYVDPFLFPAIAAKVHDINEPEFRKIAFVPLTENSRVNGLSEPFVVDVIEKQRGVYECKNVIYIQGKVGVCVRAVDRFTHKSYRNQCRSFVTTLNGDFLFSTSIKKIPKEGYTRIALHYDYELYQNGELYFQKLYVEQGNTLPMYNHLSEGSGVIDGSALREGTNEYKITAYDERGNSSTLTVSLVAIQKENQQYTTLSKGFSRPAPTPSREESSTVEYRITFAPQAQQRGSLDISLQHQRSYFVVKLGSHLPFTLRPSLWAETPTRRFYVDISAETNRRYFGTLSFLPADAGIVTLKASADINGAKNIVASTSITMVPIERHKTTVITTTREDIRIIIPSYALPQSLFCTIDSLQLGYSIKPDVVPLQQDIDVEYRVPEYLGTSRVGLFSTTVTGNKLLDWRVPNGKQVLKGKLQRYLGTVYLSVDETPPEISLRTFQYRKKNLQLVFRVSDSLAGVDADELRITIDGEPLIAEYNPYRGVVVFHEEYPLTKGAHSLRIVAQDKMGNRTTVEKQFTVK